MVQYLLSIDPGLVTSGTGLALFKDGKLTCTDYVAPIENTFYRRMRNVFDTVSEMLEMNGRLASGEIDVVVEESFYPGKANKMHQRTLGVLDYLFNLKGTIAPLTVKKQVTGSGNSDKTVVAEALMQILSKEEFKLVDWTNQDVTDAVAIGIAWMRRPIPVSKKRKKKCKKKSE